MTLYNFQVAISPDGRRVVFRAGGADSPRRLWIRELDSLELRPLPGTEIPARPGPAPFWSPDGRWVAFNAGGKLRRVEISGGFPQTICDDEIYGGAWNRDGVILLGGDSTGLRRCHAAGGPAAPVTDLARGEEAHAWPQFLPDGRHFLYTRLSHTLEKTGVFVGSLDAQPVQQETKPLLVTAQQAFYAPSESGGAGWLLFLREATLMAQPFDPVKLALSGEPVPIAGPIGSLPILRAAFFGVSNTGVLVYRGPGIAQSQLTWFDAQGRTSAIGGPGDYIRPALSPDATRIAAALTDTQGNEDIWVLDATSGASRRLTFDPATDEGAVWSPDGKKIVFQSNRGGHWDLYVKASDGSGNDQLLLKTDEDKSPESWSGDGRYLLYITGDPNTRSHAWVLPLDGPEGAPGKPFPLQQTESRQQHFRFSPGPGGTPRWIAYMSDESGAFEVYVRPFSPDSRGGSSASGERAMASSGGGLYPQWRADGKQLFYRSPRGTMMAVDVTSDTPFQTGVPRRQFDPGPLEGRSDFGVTVDGKRFLLSMPSGGREPLTVLLNWQAALKK
jgi:Tol biopolymer transport system component